MGYVLRALDKEGNVMFYTGQAGMEWLSFYNGNAFLYSKEAAQTKAKQFNKMEPVHGYWFIPQKWEMGHGE
jgi:hypothetical protein